MHNVLDAAAATSSRQPSSGSKRRRKRHSQENGTAAAMLEGSSNYYSYGCKPHAHVQSSLSSSQQQQQASHAQQAQGQGGDGSYGSHHQRKTSGSDVCSSLVRSLESSVTLSIGSQVLHKYDVKAVIGKGSFSRVLRVERRDTGELFALKMVEKRPLEGSRYESELRILKTVRHPNVVCLHEVFHSSSKVYMVMELATGGDLFDRVYDGGPLSEKQARSVMRMVLSGIAYLHDAGITHRDIKMENLLFKHPGDESRIMISDFGLAHMRAHLDYYYSPRGTGSREQVGMSTTCGTPEYLAPEVLEGECYSPLVDEWSAGVVAFTVICGAMPFMEDCKSRLYWKIKTGQYSFSEEVCCLFV